MCVCVCDIVLSLEEATEIPDSDETMMFEAPGALTEPREVGPGRT